MIPDAAEARRLLAQAGLPPPIVSHVEAVARLASAMAERASAADTTVVLAGALLHDIGRAFEQGPAHVVRGAAWLRERGVDDAVVRCVERHMGAGIGRDEASGLDWPDGTYLPETIEERIVCHADNLTFGKRYVVLADVVAKLERQGRPHVIERMRALHAGLEAELACSLDELSRAMTD